MVFEQAHRQLVIFMVAFASISLNRALELNNQSLQSCNLISFVGQLTMGLKIFGHKIFSQFFVPVDVHLNYKLSNQQTRGKFAIVKIIIYILFIMIRYQIRFFFKLLPFTLYPPTINIIFPITKQFAQYFTTLKPSLNDSTFTQNNDPFEGYEDNEENLNIFLSQYSSRAITNYPYVYIPTSIIEKYSELEIIGQENLRDIIAFRCLSNIKQNHLQLGYSILLPASQNFKRINLNQFDAARQIFTDYFERKIDSLNDLFLSSNIIEQKIKYLIVLNNYKLNNWTAQTVKEIDEKMLLQKDESGLCAAYYIQLLIKNNRPYRHIVSHIQNKFKNQQNPISYRLRIVKTLLTLPHFDKSLPKGFINMGIQLLTANIKVLTNFELLQIIKFLYMYTSSQSIQFTKSLLLFICSINLQTNKQRVNFLFPLTLKALKYSKVLKIQILPTVIELINKGKQYQPIFKLISQPYFKTTLFLWINDQPNENIKGLIKQHIFEGTKYYQYNTSNIDQLSKFLQFVHKYSKYIQGAQLKEVKGYIAKIMISISSQKDMLYECLLILLNEADEYLKIESSFQAVKSHTKMYFEVVCARNNINQLQVQSNIDQVVSLSLLVLRNQLPFLDILPQIQNYNFTITNTSQETLQKLVQYLLLADAQKINQMKIVVSKIQPIMIHNLNKKKVSFRSTINIIQLCSKVSYEKKLIYQRIEKAIFEILFKFSNFEIKASDLQLIKLHMIRRGFGSKSLQEMVVNAIDRPADWKSIKKKYVDKQEEFWRNFSKNRDL